ncbi:hypothetical protein OAT84_00985 [Gammaproteobacteria bacterium]|nr:hypothetical protein [Gammaproteobacteria bacterium]
MKIVPALTNQAHASETRPLQEDVQSEVNDQIKNCGTLVQGINKLTKIAYGFFLLCLITIPTAVVGIIILALTSMWYLAPVVALVLPLMALGQYLIERSLNLKCKKFFDEVEKLHKRELHFDYSLKLQQYIETLTHIVKTKRVFRRAVFFSLEFEGYRGYDRKCEELSLNIDECTEASQVIKGTEKLFKNTTHQSFVETVNHHTPAIQRTIADSYSSMKSMLWLSLLFYAAKLPQVTGEELKKFDSSLSNLLSQGHTNYWVSPEIEMKIQSILALKEKIPDLLKSYVRSLTAVNSRKKSETNTDTQVTAKVNDFLSERFKVREALRTFCYFTLEQFKGHEPLKPFVSGKDYYHAENNFIKYGFFNDHDFKTFNFVVSYKSIVKDFCKTMRLIHQPTLDELVNTSPLDKTLLQENLEILQTYSNHQSTSGNKKNDCLDLDLAFGEYSLH